MITKKYISKEEGSERFEKIPLKIYESSQEAVIAVADEIENAIKAKEEKGEKCVLGLATGSSPVALYKELIRRHKEEGLSFRNVITFNLDEYLPMEKDSKHSYHYFMFDNLFNHIDIPHENINIPDGTLKTREDINRFCNDYEQKIDDNGGLDIQILGIGRSGHIGFNEPGSSQHSKTRVVYLNDITIKDAAPGFGGLENVPKKAITMGIGTILKARKIILLAWGDAKADIIRETLEGKITDLVPATFLQNHNSTYFYINDSAALELTRAKYPWLVGKVKWDSRLIRKAVIWLCDKIKKPILKVEDKDYMAHGMADLIATFGSANKVNIQVFNDLQHTISGWPGGKPNADDSTRPERATPYPKRVLIFSPHPDDDVISMGGTFARLVEQGHIVHVAYQTSGNIAVFDDYVIQMLETALYFTRVAGGNVEVMEKELKKIKTIAANRTSKEDEPVEFLPYKGELRKVEAKTAANFVGVPDERVHFLNLPFYETGTVDKKPLGQEDIDIIVKLLRDIEPHQIYAAGDLADPHGTHAVCLRAILEAYEVVFDDEWFKNCNTWWYRGAWMEWEVENVDMAVPISPIELMIKRKAIFRHESQKDAPVFPGEDPREFWQRAEDRNRNTADIYNRLGMAEYEAMEVFSKYIHEKGKMPF